MFDVRAWLMIGRLQIRNLFGLYVDVWTRLQIKIYSFDSKFEGLKS